MAFASPAATAVGKTLPPRFAAQWLQTSSVTQRWVGTVTVTIFFISFFFVKTCARHGNHSDHTNRFDFEQTFESQSQFSQTVSQCLQPGLHGPGMQKSSHSQPQQTTSTFFSSHTSRQTF
jgi:hypothetical protein